MIKLYLRLIKAAALFVILANCRHGQQHADSGNQLQGVGLPTPDGIPINFISQLPATVAHELFRNIELIAQASSPNGKFADMRELPITVKCGRFSGDETRCRLVYSGPEINLKLADFLFDTMAGNVVVAKGCKGPGCPNAFKMWWRSTARYQHGKPVFDFEVCQIKGLEAELGVNQRFSVLGTAIDRVVGIPQLKGLAVTVEEYKTSGPKFEPNGNIALDENGYPIDEEKIDYRVIDAQAGFAGIGNFPRAGCNLPDDKSEDQIPSRSVFQPDSIIKAPVTMLESAPGRFVKLAVDINDYMGKTSGNNPMNISMLCQSIPGHPVCEIRYRGPQFSFPIPSYITGIFDGSVEFLRKCKNPGCKQYEEAKFKLGAYTKDGLEYLEICSMEGAELITKRRLPWQDRLTGMPDIKGMMLSIDPRAQSNERESFKEANAEPIMVDFYMGIANVGPFPNSNCEFKR